MRKKSVKKIAPKKKRPYTKRSAKWNKAVDPIQSMMEVEVTYGLQASGNTQTFIAWSGMPTEPVQEANITISDSIVYISYTHDGGRWYRALRHITQVKIDQVYTMDAAAAVAESLPPVTDITDPTMVVSAQTDLKFKA